jgi:regulator of sigma E protease
VSFRGKQTEYRLALIPLGGFVRVAGMAPADFPPHDLAFFTNRPAWQRLLVVGGGSITNWLFAFLLLTGLYAYGHRVPTGQPVVEEVTGRNAALSGFLPGDRVLAVDDAPLSTWTELRRTLLSSRDRPARVRVLRRSTELNLLLRPGPDGHIGLTPQSRVERFPAGQALSLAFRMTGEIVAGTFRDLRGLLQGTGEAQLVGPVGIITETAEAARRDLLSLCFMLVQISLALALMNLLPLPALDGGRLVFILIAVIGRRPVGARVEMIIHGLGLLALLGLLAVTTLREIGLFTKTPASAPTSPATHSSVPR